MHLNSKKHICKHCQKAFVLPQYLEEHEYTHTGLKPFVCGINGCPEQFRQRGKLSIHKKNSHPDAKCEQNFLTNNSSNQQPPNLPNILNPQFSGASSTRNQMRLPMEDKEEEKEYGASPSQMNNQIPRQHHLQNQQNLNQQNSSSNNLSGRIIEPQVMQQQEYQMQQQIVAPMNVPRQQNFERKNECYNNFMPPQIEIRNNKFLTSNRGLPVHDQQQQLQQLYNQEQAETTNYQLNQDEDRKQIMFSNTQQQIASDFQQRESFRKPIKTNMLNEQNQLQHNSSERNRKQGITHHDHRGYLQKTFSEDLNSLQQQINSNNLLSTDQLQKLLSQHQVISNQLSKESVGRNQSLLKGQNNSQIRNQLPTDQEIFHQQQLSQLAGNNQGNLKQSVVQQIQNLQDGRTPKEIQIQEFSQSQRIKQQVSGPNLQQVMEQKQQQQNHVFNNQTFDYNRGQLIDDTQALENKIKLTMGKRTILEQQMSSRDPTIQYNDIMQNKQLKIHQSLENQQPQQQQIAGIENQHLIEEMMIKYNMKNLIPIQQLSQMQNQQQLPPRIQQSYHQEPHIDQLPSMMSTINKNQQQSQFKTNPNTLALQQLQRLQNHNVQNQQQQLQFQESSSFDNNDYDDETDPEQSEENSEYPQDYDEEEVPHNLIQKNHREELEDIEEQYLQQQLAAIQQMTYNQQVEQIIQYKGNTNGVNDTNQQQRNLQDQ